MTIVLALELAGHEASAFMASGVPVDVVLLDIRMPGKSGIEVMKDMPVRARSMYPVYAMTGVVDVDMVAELKYDLHAQA